MYNKSRFVLKSFAGFWHPTPSPPPLLTLSLFCFSQTQSAGLHFQTNVLSLSLSLKEAKTEEKLVHLLKSNPFLLLGLSKNDFFSSGLVPFGVLADL
ncbi:hypothetical protein ACFX13_046899 [Malus domestica]